MAEGGGNEQTSGGTPTVFISYASQDAAVADAVVAALETNGVKCWVAPRDVVPGEFYAGAIVHAIDAAKAIVLVLSENAGTSQHVLREVERASSKRHPVVSFRIDLAPIPADLEYFLNSSQWLDASRTGVERALPKLVDAVSRAVSPTPAAGPVRVRGQAASALPLAPHHSAATSAGPRPSLTAIVLGAVIVFVLGYVAVDRLWLSKHVTEDKALAAAAPVASAGSPPMPAISEKSIAVLPFADMSEKKDQEYLADGMTEEIIDLLAKAPDLRVPARTSSFYFKGRSTKIPDIARELGVAHVLEGSIRKSGNRLRVTAQLIRADSGFHLWSETYDRDLHDVFKVQDDIANAVVQAMQITLLGGPLTRQKGGTTNLEAYQLYLRAASAELRNTRTSLQACRRYLEQAIKLDDAFGLAWSTLAYNSAEQVDLGMLAPREGLPRARREAQKALELSPDIAQAHAVLQYVYRTYDWDWAASDRECRLALALDPANSRVLMMCGLLSSTLGRWDEAERNIRAALARDPLFTYAQYNLGASLYNAGRSADAEAVFRKLMQIEPNFAWTHAYLAKALLAEGKPEDALALVRQENDEESKLLFLPIILQANGLRAEADEALKTLTEKFANTDAFFVAMTYAYRNEPDLALDWLDRAYQQKDSSLVEIVGEPLFGNLARDPRYKAFLRKMNLPE